MFRLTVAAALAAGAFAVPAAAGPEIGACRLIPMRYPAAVDVAVGIVYQNAPPVRDAVWTVCAL